MAMTRDQWGAVGLAVSHLSTGIINRYPHTVRGYVAYQHETAQNTAQTLYEQERQRQAEKKAHRMANRALIGGIAGAGLGLAGAAGVAGGLGAALSSESIGTTAALLQGGMNVGSGLATGNAGGMISGASKIAGGLAFSSSLPTGAIGSTGDGMYYNSYGQLIDANGNIIG